MDDYSKSCWATGFIRKFSDDSTEQAISELVGERERNNQKYND